jgi:hypothetical protein
MSFVWPKATRGHIPEPPAKCMQDLGYELCLTDPDLQWEYSMGDDDGLEYYEEYVILYVDDILAISHMRHTKY